MWTPDLVICFEFRPCPLSWADLVTKFGVPTFQDVHGKGQRPGRREGDGKGPRLVSFLRLTRDSQPWNGLVKYEVVKNNVIEKRDMQAT